MAPPRHALILIAAFGFFSGLPLPLSGFTLRQWMTVAHLPLGLIGATASIALPYSLKFLWAPLLDSVPPPFGLRGFGQRRGWLLAIQPLLAAACAVLAVLQPASMPMALLAAAGCVAFLSASQDIAIDAWRIEFFPPDQQGRAAAAYVWGYRIAMLVSMSGAIALSVALGWQAALLLMAGLMALAPLVTLCAPPPPARPAPPRSARAAILRPFRDLLSRPQAGALLGFVFLFKLGEVFAGRGSAMTAPFYHAMGFSSAQVAAALSLPSLFATLAGLALGGWLVARIGLYRALILSGCAQMAAIGMYFALAASHGDPRLLQGKVVVEAFSESMADAAFLAFLSRLCTPALAATQYALLSALAGLGSRTLGGAAGWLAARLGWTDFYAVSVTAAWPGLALLIWLHRRPGGRSAVRD